MRRRWSASALVAPHQVPAARSHEQDSDYYEGSDHDWCFLPVLPTRSGRYTDKRRGGPERIRLRPKFSPNRAWPRSRSRGTRPAAPRERRCAPPVRSASPKGRRACLRSRSRAARFEGMKSEGAFGIGRCRRRCGAHLVRGRRAGRVVAVRSRRVPNHGSYRPEPLRTQARCAPRRASDTDVAHRPADPGITHRATVQDPRIRAHRSLRNQRNQRNHRNPGRASSGGAGSANRRSPVVSPVVSPLCGIDPFPVFRVRATGTQAAFVIEPSRCIMEA